MDADVASSAFPTYHLDFQRFPSALPEEKYPIQVYRRFIGRGLPASRGEEEEVSAAGGWAERSCREEDRSQRLHNPSHPETKHVA